MMYCLVSRVLSLLVSWCPAQCAVKTRRHRWQWWHCSWLLSSSRSSITDSVTRWQPPWPQASGVWSSANQRTSDSNNDQSEGREARNKMSPIIKWSSQYLKYNSQPVSEVREKLCCVTRKTNISLFISTVGPYPSSTIHKSNFSDTRVYTNCFSI